MQIVKYEEQENSILVGFKKHNFVVYGMIGKIEGLTKEQHLQKLYEQCKSAIDYEEERYLQGKSNSILTELEGEEFVPEEPKPLSLVADFNSLTGKVLDQYRKLYSIDVIFSIEGTDKAKIENNTVVESEVEENVEYSVVAKYNELVEKQKRIIYAPIIVDEPVDDEKVAMAEAIVDLDNRITILEGGK